MDLYAVKRILETKDIQTTTRYAHLSPDYLKEAVNPGSLLETGNVGVDALTVQEEYRPKVSKDLPKTVVGAL